MGGGSELNFGMFGLGEEKIGETGEVCESGESGCHTWPVHCLTTNLSWLPDTMANRAQAVSTAWGGSTHHPSLCSSKRRLQGAAETRAGLVQTDDDAAPLSRL